MNNSFVVLHRTKAIKKKTLAGSSDPVIQPSTQGDKEATLGAQDEQAVPNSPPAQDPISPARPPSPVIQENENPAEERPQEPPVAPAQEDAVVTGERQTPLGASTTLAKIPAKPEPATKDKGKTALNFSSFEDQDTNTLHQAVLTRLSESRDTEIAMITSLK